MAGGVEWTRYLLEVENHATYPDELFAAAPQLPPCGLNANSARTWVDLFRGDGTRVYGFCALGASAQLNDTWFAVPRGETPHASIYMTLTDRVHGVVYTSNLASTHIGEDLPDLQITALEVTSYTEDSISYSYTITNTGSAPANLDGPTSVNHDNVSVQAFLSADEVFDNADDLPAGGTILGVSPLGMLGPGASLSGTFAASASVALTVRPHLTLKVDWGEMVAESDESNNTAAVLIDPAAQLSVRLQAVDGQGNPLSIVNVGEEFFVRAMVSDLRENAEGVFAAFMDLTYDTQLATLSGAISYGGSFPNVREGDASTVGLVDEVGATAGLDPLGADEFLLFSIPFAATGMGTTLFEANGADILPQHDSLLSGSSTAVPIARIHFEPAAVEIVLGTIVAETDEDHSVDLTVTPDSSFTITSLDATSTFGAAVTDNGDGTLRYDPRGADDLQLLRSTSEPVEDTFTYTLRDQQGGTTVATATIVVAGINDAPVVMLAASDAAVLPTIENTIEFDGVFADIEGDSLAYSATLADGSPLPAWLRLDREALRLVATPALDEVGQQIAVAIHATDSGQPARSVSDEFAILVDNPYHNEARPTDVNNDSFVTPLDALLIINDLNENRPRALPMPPESESFDPPFRDANNDLFVTPLDALLVINDLNSPNAEGESSEGDVAAFLSIGTVTTVFEPVTMFGLTSGSRDERVARSTAATSGPTESHNTIFAAFRSPSSLRAAQGVASARFDFDRTTEDLLDVISNDVARKSPAGSELI